MCVSPLLATMPLWLSKTSAATSSPPACGKNALEAVVQCLGDAQGQGVAADHAATPVAQRGRGEGKASIAGYLATATVVHDTQLPQQQGSRRGDQALSTVDQFSPAQIECDGRIADQPAAALLIQPLQVGINRTLGSDPAVLAVVHQVRDQREPGTAAYAALLAIVEAASTDLRGPLGADDAALAVVEAGAAQDGTGVGDHPAPPWLFNAPWLESDKVPALETAPPWLSSRPLFTLRRPWLLKLPA